MARGAVLLVLAACAGQTRSASHADFSDSSSSFEAARHAGLRLGFVRPRAAGAAAAGAHADKIGGLPSWPYPYPPGDVQVPECPSCSQDMPFVVSVVQPSAPSAEREDCLHVFACKAGGCARSTNSVRVFRSQRPLPVACPSPDQPTLGCAPSLVLRERAVDFEDWPDEDDPVEGDEHVEELMSSYQVAEGKGQDDDSGSVGGADDDIHVEDTHVDKLQLAFLRRIAAAPAQVVRYYSNVHHEGADPMDTGEKNMVGEPLWVCERGRMAGQVPPCARCNGMRRLEMQVMPQILNFVEVSDESTGGHGHSRGGEVGVKGAMHKYDSFQLQMDMDWGTIVTFVCQARCDLLSDTSGSGFCEEFAWRQPGLDSDSTGNIDALLKEPKNAAKKKSGKDKGKKPQ